LATFSAASREPDSWFFDAPAAETPAQFAMRAKELERSVSFPTAEN
jgi:hypothetical protein